MELIWTVFRSPSSSPRRGGVEGEEEVGGAPTGDVAGTEVSPCCLGVQIGTRGFKNLMRKE